MERAELLGCIGVGIAGRATRGTPDEPVEAPAAEFATIILYSHVRTLPRASTLPRFHAASRTGLVKMSPRSAKFWPFGWNTKGILVKK